ncbi:MAG: menaquinone biosynthesis protein [Flavobacteriales bacterium]|nr:menaquinone biosynthesis protein [Flavobacteriales bacterium]
MRTSIVAVSYLNTTPFIYGIQQKLPGSEFELSLEHPAKCASVLLEGKVDIGLVPVAALPELEGYQIISDYCIGCNGVVETVCLYSDVPLSEIQTIYLDYQSKTSVNLIKILAKELWKINPTWKDAEANYIDNITGKTAGLVIGDRTFALAKKYRYTFDLGVEWKRLTGLPFVFACWVAKKEVPNGVKTKFNKALKYGIDCKEDLISELKLELGVDHSNYLKNRILFTAGEQGKEAISLFLKYLATPIIFS